MRTRTISTMQPLTGQAAGAANNLLISRENIPVLERIDGYVNGVANTQYFLQFFAGTVLPANTTKPLFELMVLGVNGFSWDFGAEGGLDFYRMMDLPLGTQGLIVGISTTSGAFTQSAVTLTIEATVEERFIVQVGIATTGDLTTATKGVVIFANGTDHGLIAFDVTNNDVATQYIGLYPNGIPTANQIPLRFWTVAAGQTVRQYFGYDGLKPFQQAFPGGVLTTLNGCGLYVSSDPTKYVAIAGNTWTILGYYK